MDRSIYEDKNSLVSQLVPHITNEHTNDSFHSWEHTIVPFDKVTMQSLHNKAQIAAKQDNISNLQVVKPMFLFSTHSPLLQWPNTSIVVFSQHKKHAYAQPTKSMIIETRLIRPHHTKEEVFEHHTATRTIPSTNQHSNPPLFASLKCLYQQGARAQQLKKNKLP